MPFALAIVATAAFGIAMGAGFSIFRALSHDSYHDGTRPIPERLWAGRFYRTFAFIFVGVFLLNMFLTLPPHLF